MLRSLLLAAFTLFTFNALLAQQNELEIHGTGANIYLEHTVAPKENFYSIGRMFNINPKELATFNHLHFQSGLEIGQTIKIPLTKNNFTQSASGDAGFTLVPVYHTVAAGETLYRLGVNYNKVSLASLKKWNNMTSDAVSVGNKMIVGYLKVDKQLSSLAGNSENTATTSIVNEQKTEIPVSKPAAVTTEQQPKDNAAESKAAAQPAQPVQTAAAQDTRPAGIANFNGGIFKSWYDDQVANKSVQSKTGAAGVFKSTSGWQDGKYYCFSNDAAAGSILKITNSTNGRSVYAKVLDTIPDIQQNSGLVVVVSNAAASELGAGENKFDCSVSF